MGWAGEESPGDGVAFLQLPGLDVLDGAATESASGEGNSERRRGQYRGLGGRMLEPVLPVCPDRWMTQCLLLFQFVQVTFRGYQGFGVLTSQSTFHQLFIKPREAVWSQALEGCCWAIS